VTASQATRATPDPSQDMQRQPLPAEWKHTGRGLEQAFVELTLRPTDEALILVEEDAQPWMIVLGEKTGHDDFAAESVEKKPFRDKGRSSPPRSADLGRAPRDELVDQRAFSGCRSEQTAHALDMLPLAERAPNDDADVGVGNVQAFVQNTRGDERTQDAGTKSLGGRRRVLPADVAGDRMIRCSRAMA